MPIYKLTDRDRKKILHAKRECPCIKQRLLAYLFDISPSRVGEVLREEEALERSRQYDKRIKQERER